MLFSSATVDKHTAPATRGCDLYRNAFFFMRPGLQPRRKALHQKWALVPEASTQTETETDHTMISRGTGAALLVALTLLIALAAFFGPRVAQPLSHHQFADGRSWLGIADFENVISNLPFAVFGVWGLWFLAQIDSGARTFLDPRGRLPYVVFFIGVLLTAFGSAYYHLLPNNSRLAWDRLPMTIAFMALVSALIAERINVTIGIRLLFPLLCVGILSVLHWHFSELRGAGDLRFYAAVQLYAVAVLLLLLLLPLRYTTTIDLVWVGLFYLLAKLLEATDRPIYALGHVISGHTLKHLAAGMSGYFALRMLLKREPIAISAQAINAA
jgi:hypothetical protein